MIFEVLKVTETEAMQIVRRDKERERRQKYRDSQRNSLSSLISKEEPTQVNTAFQTFRISVVVALFHNAIHDNQTTKITYKLLDSRYQR